MDFLSERLEMDSVALRILGFQSLPSLLADRTPDRADGPAATMVPESAPVAKPTDETRSPPLREIAGDAEAAPPADTMRPRQSSAGRPSRAE